MCQLTERITLIHGSTDRGTKKIAWRQCKLLIGDGRDGCRLYIIVLAFIVPVWRVPILFQDCRQKSTHASNYGMEVCMEKYIHAL
jgi:hypothetical protein